MSADMGGAAFGLLGFGYLAKLVGQQRGAGIGDAANEAVAVGGGEP